MKNKDLEIAIYKWFDMKYELYSRLDYDNSIYLYDDGKEYADIRIDKKSNSIYYKLDIYDEFYDIIPLKYFEFEEFINKWVEDTFGLRGFVPVLRTGGLFVWLEIPII